MFGFGSSKPKLDINEQMKEWQSQLKAEQRGLDRQVREVQRSEDKLKREIASVAKKDPVSAKMLAKNIVRYCPFSTAAHEWCYGAVYLVGHGSEIVLEYYSADYNQTFLFYLSVGAMSSDKGPAHYLQSADRLGCSAARYRCGDDARRTGYG
jgi:hypothetical protein